MNVVLSQEQLGQAVLEYANKKGLIENLDSAYIICPKFIDDDWVVIITKKNKEDM